MCVIGDSLAVSLGAMMTAPPPPPRLLIERNSFGKLRKSLPWESRVQLGANTINCVVVLCAPAWSPSSIEEPGGAAS